VTEGLLGGGGDLTINISISSNCFHGMHTKAQAQSKTQNIKDGEGGENENTLGEREGVDMPFQNSRLAQIWARGSEGGADCHAGQIANKTFLSTKEKHSFTSRASK